MDHMSTPSLDEVLVPLRYDSINGTVKKEGHSPISKSKSDNSDSENRVESEVMSKDTIAIENNAIVDVSNVEDGEGSEAETVVLPGKSSDAPSSKKTIRHEGNGTNLSNGDEGKGQRTAASTSQNMSSTKTPKSKPHDLEGTLSNEKKIDKINGTASSSHNSPSTTSSISLQDHPQDQQHNSRSRATSESAKSRQDNGPSAKSTSASVPRKRKVSTDGLDDKSVKRRIKREENDSASTVDSKRHVSSARSESPSRQRTSTGSSNSPSVTKPRRKPPPPLVVGSGGRRKQSVDGDSNESQSPKHSAHPRLGHAADSEMMKKRRDKNGRTRVARACAANNIEELREYLRDHPEELDEPDNAGNTPLQIASLEGSTDIVKLLLKKGCKVDTENVDKDSPLIDSVENSHLAVVKLLLEAGVNPRKLNNKGEEPSELVDMDHPDGPAIKEELTKYRLKYESKRRQSTEKGPDTGRESASVKSPQGSPLLNARTPPPQTSRSRRAGRSETTRPDLLWLSPDKDTLVNFAGRGDDQAILHLLNMRPISDVEAVLAAAKGGHVNSLNLLLAMGRTNPDPDPLPDQKKGYNTPMLAAIGKGKLGVIEILLEQPGFDATRRLYKNQAYHEIAEKRQGEGWREECRILKAAYDDKKGREGKKSSAKSSRTSSPKDVKKSQKDRSPSAITVRESSPSAPRNGLPRKQAVSENKPERSREKVRDQESDVKPDRKHLKVPKRESREGSNAVSDRETTPAGDRDKRSASDQENLPKPRKRLVSGRDIKQAQRRNSLVSSVSASSAPDSVKVRSSPDEASKTRRLEVDEKKEKKRLRKSVSPQPSDASKSTATTGKRPRGHSDTAAPKTSGNATQAASMPKSASTTNTAPVALMSSSAGSEKKDAKSSSKNHHNAVSSKDKSVKADSDEKLKLKVKEKPKSETPMPDSDKMSIKEPKVLKDTQKSTDVHENSKENPDTIATSKIEQEITNSQTKESAPAKTEVEPTSSPSDFPATGTVGNNAPDTAQSVIMASTQKAADEIVSADAADDAAANDKKRSRDQEDAGEEAERHKRRREDEEVSRKRAIQEQKQRQERELYLDTLPRVFRDLLENPAKARMPEEVQTWSYLKATKGSEVDPDCPEPERDELWVTNFQVAAILVESELEMSHYTSWTRKPLVGALKNIVWRTMRGDIHRWSVYDAVNLDKQNEECYDAEVVCEKKWRALKTFWIKLSDFEGVVSRYPHLQTFKYQIRTLPTVQAYTDMEKDIDEKEKNTPSNPSWKVFPTPRTTQSPVQPTDPTAPRKRSS